MKITEETIKEYEGLVRTVAINKHREFPMIAREDIEQELWMWFITHPLKTKEWEAMESKKESTRLFVRSLNNHANRYCQYEKARSVGYEMVDLTFYQRSVVEQLLPSVISGDWNQPVYFDVTSDRHTQAPNEGGNLMAMMIEIDFGFWKLSKDDRKLLFLRYGEAMHFDEIAKEMELGSEDTARMRNKRAIKKLIHRIGGFKPYRDEDVEPQDSLES